MSQILLRVRDVDPNKSDAVKEALTPFFANLSKHKESDCIRWLRALASVIDRFPKYCISNRLQIESYLTHFLDCSNYCRVIEAAKCAHLLQRVRPTKEKTATAQSSWRDQMSALCSAAHLLLKSVFPNAIDIYDMDKLQQEHPATTHFITTLSKIDSTTKTYNKQTLLCTRLKNVLIFIQAMLVEIYPVAKPIRPQVILDVIVQALSMSSSTTGSENLNEMLIVKTQAYRTLDALMACLGSNLIPFSPLIIRMTMQTLQWSSEFRSDQSRKARAAAYNSLGQWLSILHTHRPAQDRGKMIWEIELSTHILNDICPPLYRMEFQMNSVSVKNLSKRAKRILATSILPGSAVTVAGPGEKEKLEISASEEVNDEVAIAALECAEIFLASCGIFLKPKTYQRFQELLIKQCYKLPELPAPRRLPLLRVVEAARKAAPPTAPPHTQHCLQLYSVLSNSEHREIANFCTRALLDIRMHLFCSPPPLSFTPEAPVEPQEAVRAEKKKRKQISERNRAALADLLGNDRVPKQNESEEAIITIPDEPTSKKQKLEEADKISISSESVKSIAVSDESDTESSVVQEVVEVVIENVAEKETIAQNDNLMVEATVEEAVVENKNNDEIDGNDKQMEHDSANVKISEDNIHNEVTQQEIIDKDEVTRQEIIDKAELISDDKIDSTQPDPTSDYANTVPMIHEANTQMPLNVSNDDEEETPLSMEVAYDYPNTNTEKVTVLEKLEGDNIPSSNETDDVQITCGQDVASSQDVDTEKKSEADGKSLEIKVNGMVTSPEKPLQNGDVAENSTALVNKEVTVEDMLADFVDEVNDATQATTS